MGRASSALRKHATAFLFVLSLFVLANNAVAQGPCAGEGDELQAGLVCESDLPTNFAATPLIDGSRTLAYGDPGNNIVSLYGTYGNDESNPGDATTPPGKHYNDGVGAAKGIQPLCTDGTTNCPSSQRAIVLLFIGFSNCDIEVCGGSVDIWPSDGLVGQPCATNCPNRSTSGQQAWNQANDGIVQRSLLEQIYGEGPSKVGPHVVIFNGAIGGQALSTWEFPGGFYATHLCKFSMTTDPECNYSRVATQLAANGYSEKQVQAVFLKSANGNPKCDLKLTLSSCMPIGSVTPDAYLAEQSMGVILRYLKCCEADGITPRYPKLRQVFITSRIYGGYANSLNHGCTLNPEPFAYEEGIAVQRLIVAQIQQTNGVQNNDIYAGAVDYNNAPWFDWGPYIWASRDQISAGSGLNWCNGQNELACNSGQQKDVRYGDQSNQMMYYGDFTHPTAMGAEKVATQLVKLIQGLLPSPQTNISNWVTPWIQK